MARCIRCGRDAWPNRRVCGSCIEKFKERQLAAFNQATEEIGPLSADTLPALQKRVKQLVAVAKKREKA